MANPTCTQVGGIDRRSLLFGLTTAVCCDLTSEIRRPYASIGNSTGDRQMLEWASAGNGARLKMLVYHDDPAREYAYGPAGGLPATSVGTFDQSFMDEAKSAPWTVISMKNDWKRIFAFE